MGTDPSGLFTITEVLSTGIGLQSLEKVHKANQKVGATAKSARFLVTVALVQMNAMLRTIKDFEPIANVAAAYYGYLAARFFKEYKGQFGTSELAAKTPIIAGYLAKLQGSDRELKFEKEEGFKEWKINFLSLGSKHIKRKSWIVFTGSRTRDYAIANAASLGVKGLKIADIVFDAVQGNGWLDILWQEARSTNKANGERLGGKVAGYTWHHHEILGVMLLANEKVHKKNHWGAVSFYQVLTDETYK